MITPVLPVPGCCKCTVAQGGAPDTAIVTGAVSVEGREMLKLIDSAGPAGINVPPLLEAVIDIGIGVTGIGVCATVVVAGEFGVAGAFPPPQELMRVQHRRNASRGW